MKRVAAPERTWIDEQVAAGSCDYGMSERHKGWLPVPSLALDEFVPFERHRLEEDTNQDDEDEHRRDKNGAQKFERIVKHLHKSILVS